MGSDAFNAIESWHQWQEIFDLCNVVVMHRPDATLAIKHDFIRQRLRVFSGQHYAAGYVYELLVSELAISSTYIRQQLLAAKSVQYLLPESVENYIHTHQLYN
jgi:nicotinate-nucleotide adenylyltransferase